MRTLGELALLVGLEHALHCESFKDLPAGVQLRLWEEVTPMVPITAALLHKFDLYHLLEDNRTLGGARGVHRDALELLGQYEKEQRRSATEADAHVGLRSLCVRTVHPKPKGMHGLLAPFRQLRSLSLHVFIKPDDLRCLRGMTQLRRLDLSKSSLCDKGMTYLAIASLEELSIAECKMATDVGMLALTQKKDVLTKLRVLDIARTKFTPKALITVSELTSLEAVNAACTDLDDRAFLRWTRTLRLTHLNIHATLVTDESFRHIIRMSHLRYLDMSGIFSSTQSPHAVLAAPRLEYADVSHSLPRSFWYRGSGQKTSNHLRVLVGPKPASCREFTTDIRGVCLALQTGVCDGDEDLADAAVKLLNINLTPGMEIHDDSNFEGFVASLAADKFGRGRSRQSRAEGVPRKLKFANKKKRYDHFKFKAEAGRHLLNEYFLRRIHDHGLSGPPAFTPLPPRVVFGLKFFAAAHLNYFRERQSKLVRDRGPEALLRYVGTHPCGISLSDIDVLAKNVMVYLNELFTRLRTDKGQEALKAPEYCAKATDSSASGHYRSNDAKNDGNSHKTATSPLNLTSLTQRREVGMVERAVRLLARLITVGEASPDTRVIEIVVESGGLRLAVDILWHLGMAGVDAALSLVCTQIITDLVTHATPPPKRVWGDAVSHYSSLYHAQAKAELAASRLWQSRLCKAGLLFADTDPDIGELVLHAFPLTLSSLSVSGLGQLVIGNVANYVRERRPTFAQDWFKPFQRAGFYTTRIMTALRESRTLSETASTAHDLPLRPPSVFFAHGTENALRLLLAAVLRSARAADTVGREAWAWERREEKYHANSVAEAWAKVVDSSQRFKAGFWRAACEKRATAHVRDSYAADSRVDSAVQDRCEQFVASFVEAGGVALLVDIVERASAPGGERERRIALALVEVGERYEDASLHLKREGEQWHAQWSQWERQRRIAHVAAALLRALVATYDHQSRNEARSEGKEKAEAAESSPHHSGADDYDMELEREPDVPLTSLEPGPEMDCLLARALSLHDTTPAAWDDEVGLRPYIDIVRSKRATEVQNRLRRLKKKQRKQTHPAPSGASSTA